MSYFLYVTDIPFPHIGGASKSIETLFRELVKYDHKCVTLSPSSKESSFILDGTICIQTAFMKHWLENLLKNDSPKPDAVLTQLVSGSWVFDIADRYFVPIILRVPSFTEYICADWPKFPTCERPCLDGFSCAFKLDLLNKFSRAKSIITSSFFAKEVIKAFTNYDSTVVYPTIDLTDHTVDSTGKFVTLVQGSVAKGLDFFLRLSKEFPDQQFMIVGVFQERDLRGFSNVITRPLTNDMKVVWRETKILLVPSFVAETFGRVCIEAGHNGIPIIASTYGALGESAGEESLVPVTEPDAWILRLEKLLTDESYYKERSEYARTIASTYSLERAIGSFIKVAKVSDHNANLPLVTKKKLSFRDNSKSVAFFGPWIGEFGWEIMTWQAWCRYEAIKYDKVYVCSFASMKPFYEDFAEFIPHHHWRRYWGRLLDGDGLSQVSYTIPEDVTHHILPEYAPIRPGSFKQLGHRSKTGLRCLVHAKCEMYPEKFHKNYPRDQWERIIEALPMTVGCIGTKDTDLSFPNTKDLRGIPLTDLFDAIAGADVVIGQSSGIMHLACLCKTPIVVWGPNTTPSTNLQHRYKIDWNPFGNKVEYMIAENWRPDPEDILILVERILGRPKRLTLEDMKAETGIPFEDVVNAKEANIFGRELRTLYETSKYSSASVVVELGPSVGTASIALASIAKMSDGKLYSISDDVSDAWQKEITHFKLQEYAQLIPAKSPEIDVSRLPFKEIDYLFLNRHSIDYGSFDDILADFRFWSKLVRPGGRIAVHDYFGNDNVRMALYEILKSRKFSRVAFDWEKCKISTIGLAVYEKKWGE